MVTEEILRVTKLSLSKVRPHSATRPETLHQSWAKFFSTNSAPRPRFKLFQETGVALIYLRRKPIELYRRCLGLRTTRGCPRTPVCLNWGLTNHSLSECKAPSHCHIVEAHIDRIAGIAWHAPLAQDQQQKIAWREFDKWVGESITLIWDQRWPSCLQKRLQNSGVCLKLSEAWKKLTISQPRLVCLMLP